MIDHVHPHWTTPPEEPTPTPATPFGALLKQHREARGYSQSTLAILCGFDHSAISRWESGHRQASRETVSRLADELRLAPAEQDALYLAAGYVPPGQERAIHALLAPLNRRLLDMPALDAATRAQVDAVLTLLLVHLTPADEPVEGEAA